MNGELDNRIGILLHPEVWATWIAQNLLMSHIGLVGTIECVSIASKLIIIVWLSTESPCLWMEGQE